MYALRRRATPSEPGSIYLNSLKYLNYREAHPRHSPESHPLARKSRTKHSPHIGSPPQIPHNALAQQGGIMNLHRKVVFSLAPVVSTAAGTADPIVYDITGSGEF